MLLQKGGTALIMASQNGHLEVVQLLFREGKCNPHLKDKVNACTERPFAPLLLKLGSQYSELVGIKPLIYSVKLSCLSSEQIYIISHDIALYAVQDATLIHGLYTIPK